MTVLTATGTGTPGRARDGPGIGKPGAGGVPAVLAVPVTRNTSRPPGHGRPASESGWTPRLGVTGEVSQ